MPRLARPMVTPRNHDATMRRRGPNATPVAPSLLLALLLLAAGAAGIAVPQHNASLVQNDAESGGDAPDACISNDPSDVEIVSNGTYGQLVPLEDPADVYSLTVRSGETIDVVQDLASSDDSTIGLNLPRVPYVPHAPAVPHVEDAALHDTDNPFALQVLDPSCTVVATSDDPAILPRTITLDNTGTYQIKVYESGGTSAGTMRSGASMCHPPCRIDGYLVEAIKH